MKASYQFLVLALCLCGSHSLLQSQWIQTNGPYGGTVVSFAVLGTNMFAGTHNGVYLSTNSGTSWTSARAGLLNDVRCLAV